MTPVQLYTIGMLLRKHTTKPSHWVWLEFIRQADPFINRTKFCGELLYTNVPVRYLRLQEMVMETTGFDINSWKNPV